MTEREISCPTCGSTDVIEGDLSSTGGFVLIPESEKGRCLMRGSFMKANACRSCGAVFDLRLCDKAGKLTG